MKTTISILNVLVVVLLLSAPKLLAQEEETPSINTDRPGLGESSQVLPQKRLQIETGGNFEFDKSKNGNITASYQNILFNSTVIRYGLFEKVEVRLGFNFAQNFWQAQLGSLKTSGQSAFGFTPWSLGFKAQISENKGAIPQIAFEGNLGIPYPAADDFKTTYVAPNFIIPISWGLNDMFSTAVNLGAYWDGDSALPEYFTAFGIDAALPGNFGTFVEWYMFITEDGDITPGFNGGFTWQLLPNLQLDVSVGVGMSKGAPDGFLNGGISFCLPN